MNIFSFIKSRVAIFDVVNDYTTLKKTGGYYKSRCPFHHEKTASFTVSPQKEIFYCFGCHLGGDVITFISKVENCSQIEAAQFLAERYSIEIPEEISQNKSNENEKKQYFQICQLVAQWCHQQLKKNRAVLQYLAKRGIDGPFIDYFTLGFFPGGLNGVKNLITAMAKENVLADDLIDANIISKGKSVLFSSFEDRIIFPIKDHLGRFCAFGGRVYKPTDTRAKYYNSRENNYFVKGSLLFGLDLAKKSTQKSDAVYLVEGYTDCIAMVQHGYPNTVATLGTACTIAHLKQLSRYAHTLYLLYDNDKAGHQAILRLAQMCWQANMELYVVTLPSSQDPASFLNAKGNMAEQIAQSQDIFLFYINSLGHGFATKPLHEKVELTRSFLETIAPIQDSLKQDFLVQRASKTFDLPFESIKNELKKHIKKDSPAEGEQVAKPESQLSALEKRIFCAIVQNVRLLKNLEEFYPLSWLGTPLNTIAQGLWEHREENFFDFTNFFDSLNQYDQQLVSQLLLEHKEEITQEMFNQMIQQLYKKQWKTVVQQMKKLLECAKHEGNPEKTQAIMNRFAKLKQKMMPAAGNKSEN